MFLKKCTALVAAGLILANCATVRGEDEDRVPWGWIIAGVAAVAVVVAVVAAPNAPSINYPCSPDGCISDERLKRDIAPVDTLPNGIRLYSFRYWNDDRVFVGVMAQDLLQEERFRHAVVADESGYYRVNFSSLGLGIAGDAVQFIEAGEAAVAGTYPIVN